ncbi:FadR/GntR family transcriptional regulator [Rhizorhabdus histidinilytica]|uniref:Transcriptional regulator, GntR family n=1 Tax=Rhizorhabdus histidinilytica TaxID=439228 RepID=A0A1T5GAE1_9SPHN|nr:FCD domain-containing protein [Rhizorhabdus histidinilytica]SKC05322.1 transcriptional regulator, GntR family [Rhizorhabdus histidinilytica]
MTKESRPNPYAGQIKPHYLVDQVITAIQDAIDKGVFKVGDRLPSEARLGADFGVGRSTIREALRVLSHLNRVETRTGSGSYVVDNSRFEPAPSEMSLDEVEAIYDFRYTIEAPAAEQAALRHTSRQMKTIRRLLAETKRQVDLLDMDGVAAADTDLHIAILEAAGSSVAVEVYQAQRHRWEQALKSLITLTGPIVKTSSAHAIQILHDELIDAIERRDGKAAVRLVHRDRDEVGIRVAMARRNATTGTRRRATAPR